MSASPPPAIDTWAPFSPDEPRVDPEHEARTVAAVARALRDIPYYQARKHPVPSPGTPLREALSRLPLLLKKDVRPTLPRQWIPAGRDTKAELASGGLALG